MLGVPTQLNVFAPPIVQSAIERVLIVEYRPTNQISSQDAPVVFVLGGNSKHYLDLKRTKLYLKAKISKEDGTDIVKGAAVCPINLTLQSLWSQIDIKISGQSLSLSNNTYPLGVHPIAAEFPLPSS